MFFLSGSESIMNVGAGFEDGLALGLAAVSTQDRHTRASVLRHHAYRPPRSSNFRGMKPTWAQAASTPTSRIGAL